MRLLTLVALTATLAAVFTTAASAELTTPTTQAVAAHAEFLAFAPPPPSDSAACWIDTGVRSSPDTDPVVLYREALDPGQTPDDTSGDYHGSRGVMTAFAPSNGWGTIGLWPHGRAVTINALPVAQQGFPFGAYRAGISRCVALASIFPIRVIVLALSAATAPSPTEMVRLSDAVDRAQNAGISVVAAAGNAPGDVEWPAAYPPVLAIGAADPSGTLCSFSARGPELDLIGPGCPIQEAAADTGEPVLASGTTGSADLVAAALDALRAYRPDLPRATAEQVLVDAAAEGRLDVRAAFEAAGLHDVVVAGDRAVPGATAATPSTNQLLPAPPPSEARQTSSPPRSPRGRWPAPRPRLRRRGSHMRVVLRAFPAGASCAVVVKRPASRGTVRTVARHVVRRSVATFVVPIRGRLQVLVRYVADQDHASSPTVRLGLR
jgi:hypothetical protein